MLTYKQAIQKDAEHVFNKEMMGSMSCWNYSNFSCIADIFEMEHKIVLKNIMTIYNKLKN